MNNASGPFRSPRALLLGVLLLALGSTARAQPSIEPLFEVRRLDGSVVAGRLAELDTAGTLRLEPTTGPGNAPSSAVTIPLAEVVSLLRRGTDPDTAWPTGSQVLFPGRDRLRAVINTARDGALTVLPGCLADEPTGVPLDAVLGMILAPPADPTAALALAAELRDAPRPAEVLRLANGDRLEGSLLGVEPQTIPFETDAGPQEIPRGNVIAIGFNPELVRYPAPEGTWLEVLFLDGSRLGLSAARLDGDRLAGTTRFGAAARPKLGAIQAIQVRGPGIAYLAERTEAGAQYVGYLGDHPRAYGRDATWDGKPLRHAGRAFEHGLGTLPRTLIAYRLEPADRRFQALVGLDDSAGPRAHLVLRVLVDGQERFNSGPLTRGAAAVPVDVDVAGGRVLILATEFGEGGDVHDSAIWAEARLVRKP
jgi:hypothetical protein